MGTNSLEIPILGAVRLKCGKTVSAVRVFGDKIGGLDHSNINNDISFFLLSDVKEVIYTPSKKDTNKWIKKATARISRLAHG